MTKVSTTVEELIIAIETDHGIPQAFDHWTLPGEEFDGIGAACAMGNAALDYVKRAGGELGELNDKNVKLRAQSLWYAFDRLRNRLESQLFPTINGNFDNYDAFKKFVVDTGVPNMNDNKRLSFAQIGASVRDAFSRNNIPLDTPIDVEF